MGVRGLYLITADRSHSFRLNDCDRFFYHGLSNCLPAGKTWRERLAMVFPEWVLTVTAPSSGNFHQLFFSHDATKALPEVGQ